MGARNKSAKKTAEKAAELVATLPVKRADEVVVADLKRLVNELTRVMNEADAASLSVNFNIGKNPEGRFTSTISISKVL